MKSIKVYHYDAFSNKPNMGNLAGVVLTGDELTKTEMQEVAFKVGFNETSFLVRSEVADYRILYFTPGHEMNLCGHGTIATIFALKEKGLLQNKCEIKIETNVGILPIKLTTSSEDELFITMKQAAPQFKEFSDSKEDLANSIGLTVEDFDKELPIIYGSTGTWTLLVPIKHLESFKKMKPNNKQFPNILKEMPKASVHPFCLETSDLNVHMHGRHFSSPYSGTIEDPVTGTASGVMGAYYAKYVDSHFDETLKLIIEQGHEIGKDGQVIVHVSKTKGTYENEITGTAVYVNDFDVLINENFQV